MARPPRTPRPRGYRKYSKRLRELCWTDANHRRPYDSLSLSHTPCPQCGCVGRYKQSITFKEGHSGEWHRICLNCGSVHYPLQPEVPEWIREEIRSQQHIDDMSARATQSTGGGRRRLWRPTFPNGTPCTPRFGSCPPFPSRSLAMRTPRTPRSHGNEIRRMPSQGPATPGPSNLRIILDSPDPHDLCAFDEQIARRLQRRLDEEGKHNRAMQRAENINDVGPLFGPLLEDVQPSQTAPASPVIPLRQPLQDIQLAQTASIFPARPPRRLAPFLMDVDVDNSAGQSADLQPTPPPPPCTQPRCPAPTRRVLVSEPLEIISISSDSESNTPTCALPPLHSRSLWLRKQRDLDVISISSDTDLEEDNPPAREIVVVSSDGPSTPVVNRSQAATCRDDSRILTNVLHTLFQEDPERTALIDAPFQGMPADGYDMYQPDVVYPWEISSSDLDFDIPADHSTSTGTEHVAANTAARSVDVGPNIHDAVHGHEVTHEPTVGTHSTSMARGVTWYLNIVIWHKVRHHTAATDRNSPDEHVQNDILPATKSIRMDHEGIVFLKDIAVVRRVFVEASVKYFHLWSFMTTSWQSHSLGDAIYVSTERQHHTLLLRVASAQRCPLFEVKLLNASSECSSYGPPIQTSAPAISEKAKGKRRADD
ncbi:hypothetical protein ONZ51_g7478 [Trametes cubensis]|uniref:Uncharacterized protein n=1 Tax=Trametes cubensis TaxID=1111947 RepID=A0AAD7TQ19_9APHY|nr:hypothetical protein ONZ51_g7478 [Trametes cubensis]